MVQCTGCDRHHRASESECPFCQKSSPIRTAMNVVGGAVTLVVLAACYGGPGGNPPTTIDTSTDPADMDGDGFETPVDCNDDNPLINPDATEDCVDGVDNDCNELVDDADPACEPPVQ